MESFGKLFGENLIDIPLELPGWFWTLLYIGLGFITFRFVALNIFKPILKYRTDRYKASLGAGGSANPLTKYDSAGEMLEASETAILVQMKDVEKQHKGDPMKDETYQILQNQRDRIIHWRQRLSNPVVSMLDQTFFPVFKGVIPDAQRTVKRWMKEL